MLVSLLEKLNIKHTKQNQKKKNPGVTDFVKKNETH